MIASKVNGKRYDLVIVLFSGARGAECGCWGDGADKEDPPQMAGRRRCKYKHKRDVTCIHFSRGRLLNQFQFVPVILPVANSSCR